MSSLMCIFFSNICYWDHEPVFNKEGWTCLAFFSIHIGDEELWHGSEGELVLSLGNAWGTMWWLPGHRAQSCPGMEGGYPVCKSWRFSLLIPWEGNEVGLGLGNRGSHSLLRAWSPFRRTQSKGLPFCRGKLVQNMAVVLEREAEMAKDDQDVHDSWWTLGIGISDIQF